MTKLIVGGYTPDKGHGAGIAIIDPWAVIPAESPSFLAWHPRLPVLYAVAEVAEGYVGAWAMDGSSPTPLTDNDTGGADPCHLSVDPSGEYLVTVNYTGGSVAVHRLDTDGGVAERTDLVQHTRHGTHARQDAAHPHMVRMAGDGLIVTDLGGDALYRYHLDDGRLVHDSTVDTPAGTGPRHILRVGTRWYVTAELSGEVLVYAMDWTLLGRVPTTTSTVECLPSEVAASVDGRFLYVANRGPDTVTVFALGGDLPTRVTEVETGHWPRHIAVAGNQMFIANERSDRVTFLRIDVSTGIPATVSRLVIPSPTCVLTR